jgi:glycosyltransferase involved in cell wall biosynthesis
MREVVDDGVTGLLVANADEAVAAVERAVALDRAACRRAAARRFSAERMVDDYLRVYEQVLAAA